MLRRWLMPALLGLAVAALAQTPPAQVQLNGMLGSRAALLMIDGEPRTMEVGATAKGVRLVALEDGRAVVEVAGRRQTLVMGAAPARIVSSAAAPRQIVMAPGQGGHYTTIGTINGQTTSFLLDTGATSVAIGQIEADKLGLRYLQGRRIVTQTANGSVPAFMIELVSIRIGDVEVRNVNAIVIPGQMSHVLLGNSFLSRFQMRRENDVMTLELRYRTQATCSGELLQESGAPFSSPLPDDPSFTFKQRIALRPAGRSADRHHFDRSGSGLGKGFALL